MFRKDVTQVHSHKPRKRVSNIGCDKRVFSNTADRTHRINTMSPARPMRGGIRL